MGTSKYMYAANRYDLTAIWATWSPIHVLISSGPAAGGSDYVIRNQYASIYTDFSSPTAFQNRVACCAVDLFFLMTKSLVGHENSLPSRDNDVQRVTDDEFMVRKCMGGGHPSTLSGRIVPVRPVDSLVGIYSATDCRRRFSVEN